MNEKRQKILHGFVLLAALGCFLALGCYRLTWASLWFDETVEYDISTMSLSSGEMQAGILTTFQPPLYNWVMHFWLTLRDSEWWFRFSGVVFGLIGMVGMHFAVKRATGSFWAGIAAIFTYAFSVEVLYYFQECAEYALMLGILPWLLYFYIRLVLAPDWLGVLGWAVCCVLAMYTQYGAAFPVIATGVCLMVRFARQKEKTWLIRWLAVGGGIGAAAGVPLVLIYLRHQSSVSGGQRSPMGGIADAIIQFFQKLYENLHWIFLGETDKLPAALCVLLTVLLIALGIFFGIKKISPALPWLLGGAAVSFAGLYAACFGGWYGRPFWGDIDPFVYRYTVNFAPFACAVIVSLMWATLHFLMGKNNKSAEVCRISAGCILTAAFCALTWTQTIQYNWIKNDNRGVVDYWFHSFFYDLDTILYEGEASPFLYYLRHTEGYSEAMEKNLLKIPDLASIGNLEDYLEESYPDGMPETILLPYGHDTPSMYAIADTLKEMGYTTESVWYNNFAGIWICKNKNGV